MILDHASIRFCLHKTYARYTIRQLKVMSDCTVALTDLDLLIGVLREKS